MTLLSDMQILTGEIASRYIDPILESLNEAAMDLNEEGLVLLSDAVGEFMSGVGMLGLEDMQQSLGRLVGILEGEGALDRRLFEFKEQFEVLIADLPRISETGEVSGEAPAPDVPAAGEELDVSRYIDPILESLNEAAMDLNEEGLTLLSDDIGEFKSGMDMLGREDISLRIGGLLTILEGEGALDRRLFEFKEQFEALIADLPRMPEAGGAPSLEVPAAQEGLDISRYIDPILESLNEAAMDLNEEGLTLLSDAVGEFKSDMGTLGREDIEQRIGGLLTILEGEGALDRRLFEFKEQFEALIADLPRMSETGEAPAPGVPAAEEESAIRRFTQIPGVGEERARILFRAGFTSLSALAEASVARLFRIEGISLSLARDIADYLNPERFIDMEIMPPSRPKVKVEPEPSPPSFPISDPETAAELEAEIEAFFSDPLNHEPFSGAVKKKKESRLDDDPELLIMFIERFRTYMAHIGRLVDSMGQTPPVPVHVEELIDVSRSLAAVSRYMGFSDIGEEAGRVSEAAGGLGQGSDDRQDALFDIIRTAHTRLISELEKFKRSAEVQGAGKTDPKMEILNMLMSRWGELDELYSQVGRIIERASTVGVLDEETRRILKGKTIEIDTVASSLSELLDKEK